MFFEKESIAFQILDVVRFQQGKFKCTMRNRNYDAISYRFAAKTILSTDTQEIYASDGSVCFIPARIRYTRDTELEDLIAVHINTDNAETSRIDHFVTENPELLQSLFLEIAQCWEKKEVGYKYKCAARLNEILAECYRENYIEQAAYGSISDSVEYLNRHFKDPDLTISEVASKSFVSEVYFRRKFKECFGMSPAKYLIHMRIQHAAVLMDSGYYSLKEVAYRSGYKDYPYFSAEFKRIKGVSPSEYIYNY